MDNELLGILSNYGIFSLLFGYLLFYVLKQNQIREENYQSIIQETTKLLPQIMSDIKEIKEHLNSKERGCRNM